MIYTYSMPSDLTEIQALLASVPLLSGLGEQELLELAGQFSSLTLAPGQTLYQAGAATDGLYLLAHGKIQFTQEDLVKILTPGEWIGEESLQGQAQRSASAQALTDCTLLFLDNQQVREQLLGNPAVNSTFKVMLRSRKMAEHLPVAWLQPDEEIFLMTRKHSIFLLLNVLWPILSFSAVIALVVLFAQAWAAVAAVVLTGAFTLCGLWLAWNINNWANDFYVITSKRLVWVEHVSGLYDSRQEAPLGTLLSVGIQTTYLGALFKYSDIVVRTYVGNIRFNRVGDAQTIAKLIEVYWKKSKTSNREEEAVAMRSALRRKLGASSEAAPEEKALPETAQLSAPAPAEGNFFSGCFMTFYVSISKKTTQ